MKRILRWLVEPSRSPLVVVVAFILGNAAGVEAGTGSSVWVDALIVFVAMGGLQLLRWLVLRITRTQA